MNISLSPGMNCFVITKAHADNNAFTINGICILLWYYRSTDKLNFELNAIKVENLLDWACHLVLCHIQTINGINLK